MYIRNIGVTRLCVLWKLSSKVENKANYLVDNSVDIVDYFNWK